MINSHRPEDAYLHTRSVSEEWSPAFCNDDVKGSPILLNDVATAGQRSSVTFPSPDDDIDNGDQDSRSPSPSPSRERFKFSKPIGYLHRNNPFNAHNFNSRNEGLNNPIPRSDRANLCGKMLESICGSVSQFKPSNSIAASMDLMRGAGIQVPEIEIDLVLSGGGLKGYYMAGASYVLLNELEKQNVRISRVAGASAGAWAGFFILTGFSTADWIETYFGCQRNIEMTLLEAYEAMWPFVSTLIPEDAYIHCSGRLFISLTEITPWGLRNRMISQYDSNNDLFEACLASSTIPWLTERNGVRRYKGMVVCDGGFSNNTPVFDDGIRRQLIFRLYEVEYPWRLLTSASDTCIEALVLRGAILMSRFLQGDPGGDGSISWLDRKDSQVADSSSRWSHLSTFLRQSPRTIIRLLFTPLTVTGMILSKGSRNLLQAVGLVRPRSEQEALKAAKRRRSFGDGTNVVPFRHLERDTGASYLRWVLWGSLVEFLERMGFLM